MLPENITIGLVDTFHTGAFDSLLPYDYEARPDGVLLGAIAGEYAAGILWAELYDEYCEILHIAVHPVFRRKGIGSLLVDRFLSSFYEMDRPEIVCMHFVEDESNTDFRRFLDATGLFMLYDDGVLLRVGKADIPESARYCKIIQNSNIGKEIVPFFSVPKILRKKAGRLIAEKGYFVPDDFEGEGEGYEKDLSLCYIKNNRIVSGILVRICGDCLDISYLFGNNEIRAIMNVLSAAAYLADQVYPEMDIEANMLNSASKKAFEFLFKGACRRYPIVRAVWNLET